MEVIPRMMPMGMNVPPSLGSEGLLLFAVALRVPWPFESLRVELMRGSLFCKRASC